MAHHPPLNHQWYEALCIMHKSCGTSRSSGTLDHQEIYHHLCCDGCSQAFSIQHAMMCKKGGLVIIYHNKIGDELATKALTLSAICNKPAIYPHGCTTDKVITMDAKNAAGKSPVNHPKASSCDKDRGDLLI